MSKVDIKTGTKVSQYTISGKLDHGYPEDVFLAVDNNLNRKVLLQFPPSWCDSDQKARDSFIRDSQTIAEINHPNLANIYEVAEHDGRPFVAIEYVGERTLFDIIREGGLSLRHALDIATQMCTGLRIMHESGIAHRDLRPDQVAIDKAFHIKLLMMGHLFNSGADPDKQGEVKDISDYLSPEQVAGEVSDYGSNVFTIGVILYEMITGKNPFRGRQALDIRKSITAEDIPLARDKSKIPKEIGTILKKTLDGNRDARYLNIEYLQTDLETARTVHELRESEEQYRNVVERANDGICIIQNKLLKFINRRLADMVGYTVEEGVNTSFADYIHPDEIARVVEKYNLQITGRETSQSYETVLIHKNGEMVPIEINAGLITYGGYRAILAIVRDISLRKQAQAALQESEEKFSSIFQMSNDAIFIHNLEGDIIDVNRKTREMFGYTRPEMLNLKIADLHPPSALEASRQAFETITRDGVVNMEIDFKKKDGCVFPAEVSASIFEIGGQKVVQGVVRDITGRRKIEDAIKESRRALATLMNNLPGMAYRCRNDRDWTMELVSGGCRNLTGYEASDVVNNAVVSYNDLIHPDDRENVWQDVQTGVDKGEPFQLVYRINTKDNKEKWVWEQGCGVFSADGELLALEGFITDITQRKQAEDHSQLLSSIVKQSTEGFALSDLEGNLQFVNQAFAEMHGYKPEELLHKNLVIFHTPEQLPEVKAAIRKIQDTGEFSGEIWHKRRDGTVFPSIMHNSLLRDRSGEPVGMIGVIRDITNRKKADRELGEAHEQLEATLNALPDLLFEVDREGHILDFRAPDPQLLYIPPEEFMGRKMQDCIPENAARVVMEAIQEAFSTGRSSGGLYELETPRGLCWFELSAAVRGDIEASDSHVIVLVRDITDRKQAEEAVRESEEKYRRIFENSILGMYRTTPDGQVLMVNPALLNMLGYATFEELASRNLEDSGYEPGYERSAFKDLIESKGVVEGLESAWIKKDATTLYVRESARAIRDDDGKILYYEGTVEDITDRKMAETALKESEERYRLLIENAGNPIILHDPDGRTLMINSTAAKLLDGEPEDLIGKEMHEIFPDSDKVEFFMGLIRQIIETGVGQVSEYNMELPTGNRWFWSNLQLVKDGDGNVMGVQVILHDITERKLAEKELEKTTKLITQERNLFINGPVVVFKWQNRTGWPVEYVSPNVYEVFGYTPDEVVSGRIAYADIISEDDIDSVINEINAYSESGVESFSHQPYRIIRKDGRIIWVADYTTILRNKDGKITHYLGYVIDITERKLAEEMLRKRTEQLNAERKALKNKNITLNQLLEHMESQKQGHQQQVYKDVEKALTPFLRKLKEKAGPGFNKEYNALIENFHAILAKDLDEFTSRYARLTARESEICDLIKEGMSSKQISESLNLSVLTVLKHREQIRKKLEISNKSINLATYLRSH